MPKFLPKSAKNPQGFTLVELLVVVSIIAILSVVGITVFSNVQKNARDARRKADIDAMAKALEASYDGSTGFYPLQLTSDMFGNSVVPQDPLDGKTSCPTGTICKYCWSTSFANCNNASLRADVARPRILSTTFTLCANLEGTISVGGSSLTYYCRSNQQ